MFEYTLLTPKAGMIDITQQLEGTLYQSQVTDGILVVFVPHTTAGVTINENADPHVTRDILLGLREAFPDRQEFRHSEGNSFAHLRSSAVGSSVTIIVKDGSLVLGTWQGVYFCEFDGPRSRKYYVKLINA
jgi:secondary thiamine-phosphate synthase enzyme